MSCFYFLKSNTSSHIRCIMVIPTLNADHWAHLMGRLLVVVMAAVVVVIVVVVDFHSEWCCQVVSTRILDTRLFIYVYSDSTQ